MSFMNNLRKVFEKIKERLTRTLNLTPRIEEAPDRIYTPKENDDTHGDYEEIDNFLQELDNEKDVNDAVKEMNALVDDLDENPVSFEEINKERCDKLGSNLRKIGAKFGWTHSSSPVVTGKIKGEDFVCLERVNDSGQGKAICTDNGVYDVMSDSYKENITNEDGTKDFFAAYKTNSKDAEGSLTKKKDGITMREVAGFYSRTAIDGCFKFCSEPSNEKEPSNEILEAYSNATGLPVYSYNADQMENLKDKGIQFGTLQSSIMTEYENKPFVVAIETEKDNIDFSAQKRKCIKYLYTNKESYLKGEKPEMVYVEGVDGRKGPSGMFRLQGDSYIDNSTFRKEDGEYKFDKVTLEEIQGLMGNFPTDISPRLKSVINGDFNLPPLIQKVLDKAKEVITEREAKKQEKETEKKSEEVDTSKDKKKEDDDGDFDPE